MKFALLRHTIVKEFLLALHKGHTHKLKVTETELRPPIKPNPLNLFQVHVDVMSMLTNIAG